MPLANGVCKIHSLEESNLSSAHLRPATLVTHREETAVPLGPVCLWAQRWANAYGEPALSLSRPVLSEDFSVTLNYHSFGFVCALLHTQLFLMFNLNVSLKCFTR